MSLRAYVCVCVYVCEVVGVCVCACLHEWVPCPLTKRSKPTRDCMRRTFREGMLSISDEQNKFIYRFWCLTLKTMMFHFSAFNGSFISCSVQPNKTVVDWCVGKEMKKKKNSIRHQYVSYDPFWHDVSIDFSKSRNMFLVGLGKQQQKIQVLLNAANGSTLKVNKQKNRALDHDNIHLVICINYH